MSLESLYPRVTEAILRAEALDDLGEAGASDAYLHVSLLEEEIAQATSPSAPEGELARRGAVRAAVAGGDMRRARELVERFATEPGASDDLRRDVLQLLTVGSRGIAPSDNENRDGTDTRPTRVKHPDAYIEQVLQEAEQLGFQVDNSTKGCLELICTCGLDTRFVALDLRTSRDVARDLRRWCETRSCWEFRRSNL